MTPSEIFRKLDLLFQEVFDDPVLSIDEQTTAKDVAGWDSLTHITLILAVEEAFSIKFATREIVGFKNVGDLAKAIARRLAAVENSSA